MAEPQVARVVQRFDVPEPLISWGPFEGRADWTQSHSHLACVFNVQVHHANRRCPVRPQRKP